MSYEMEAALVGRAISDPEALTSLSVRPYHLSDTFLRITLETALELSSRGSEANLITLSDASEAIRNRAGDLARLTSDAAVGRMDYYEDRIIEEYRRRELHKLGSEIAGMDEPSDEILGWIESRLEEVTTSSEAVRVRSIREVVRPTLDRIEERYKSGGELPGLRTGFDALDNMILGLRPRMLHYIAARPSQGKSAILLNMAMYVAKAAPVGMISLESDATELTMRAISSEGSINASRLSTGRLDAQGFADLSTTVERIADRPLYYYDQPNAPLERVVSIARMMHRRYHIQALFVDYLQIITVTGRDLSKRERVETASLRLKQLARELEIPVICGAQAKREDGNRPNLESFQHADQPGQDSDVSVFLFPQGTITWAIVEKNRDGAKGDVALTFEGRYVRFVEEKDQENLPTF